jgi:hypothetical protein
MKEMKIEVINNQVNRISYSSLTCLTRRNFLKASVIVSMGLILPKETEGFLFGLAARLLVRTVARRFIRSAIRRSAGSAIRRSASSAVKRSRSIRKSLHRGTRKKNKSQKSVSESVLSELPSELAESAVSNAVEAIWVGNDHDNNGTVCLENHTGESKKVNMYLFVEDAETGKEELKKHIGSIQTEPHSEHSFEISIRDLPSSGIKRLGLICNTESEITKAEERMKKSELYKEFEQFKEEAYNSFNQFKKEAYDNLYAISGNILVL